MSSYARVEYPDLTGSAGSFVVPFQYFSEDEIEVYVDGTLLDGTTYTISGSNIEFLSGFFPEGRLIIRRVTDLAEPSARFSPNSPIRTQDLNAAMDQSFFAIQEVVDGFRGLGIEFTADGGFLLPASSVGLGNVANIAPDDLPISTATQAALDLKLDASVFDPDNIFQIVAERSGGPTDGLNAETLDGASLSHVLDWRNFSNKPSAYPPTPHTHSAADIATGVFPAFTISLEAVKQHEQALSINYTQLRGVPPGALGEIPSDDGKLYLRRFGAWEQFDPEENEVLSGLGISLSDILGD